MTPRTVAVVQTRPAFGEVARNLEAARALLAGTHADLIVLPELFATGYQFVSREEACALAEPLPGGPTVAALEAIARETGATVVGGVAERNDREGVLHNSAAIVNPSGYLGAYRKTHLFFEERDWFVAGGDLPPVVRTPSGLRVGVMICFDWYFPEVARHLALFGADIIAHPANLVLPHCPGAMPVRCLENRVFAATANRVGAEARGGKKELRYIGRSQIVSPGGERLAALGAAEEAIASAPIDPALARSKRLTVRDDLFAARRADLFGGPAVARHEGEFAALLHERPGAGDPPHVDLLFEVAGGRLVAFRVASIEPLASEAVRAFDHRRAYLEKEGDLGGGRGALRRLDRGRAAVEEGAGYLRVHASGAVLFGTFVFRAIPGEDESERWSLAREA